MAVNDSIDSLYEHVGIYQRRKTICTVGYVKIYHYVLLSSFLWMKLIIQIPCKNEEEHLPLTFSELPKHIEGIDTIEYQIIDDGSSDKTAAIAEQLGVHHIVGFKKNRWLWNAFKAWVTHALEQWADIVVNTDADNQYPWRYIPALVRPILEHKADMVIGNRNPTKIKHFSFYKKFFQRLGNKVVWLVAGVSMPDAVSGFRAYSRESLYALNVTSRFSYVIDTIIQAQKKGLEVQWVDIETNPPTRPSRLFGNIREHIKKSTSNIIRVYTMYEPFKIFLMVALPFLALWVFGVGRYILFYLQGKWWWNIQSLIISSIVIMIGFNFFSLWVIGDVIAKNRTLLEENMRMMKKLKYEKMPAYMEGKDV